jgi:hypothetical protein
MSRYGTKRSIADEPSTSALKGNVLQNYFGALERATLIQDRRVIRTIDSKISSP